VKCDVSKEDEVKAMVQSAVDQFGRLDVLVRLVEICGEYKVPQLTLVQQRWYHAPSVSLGSGGKERS